MNLDRKKSKGVNVLKRTLTKQDLLNSFFHKLKQKNISAKEAASGMCLAPSTLSMWKEKGAIPVQQLANAAAFLKDHEFSGQVSNYFFGIPTVIEDKDLKTTDPLSVWVHLLNVEKNKSSICGDLEEVLDHFHFNFEDREIVIHAVQMMRTEAGLENHLSNLLIEKYGVTDKELHPKESKFDKFRKNVVKTELNNLASN